MQRWTAPRFEWLLQQEQEQEQEQGWGRGPRLPDFCAHYPKNWAQIEEGYDEWRLPDAALLR